MIYSAALLHTCAGVGKSLLDSNFQSSTSNNDINTLVRSRQEFQIQPTTHISSIFQHIVDCIVKYIKRCSEGFSKNTDRMFWMQRHHCDWMLIYWLCDTFEAFSTLFDAIGFRSPNFHPVSMKCLIGCSLIRKDMEFPTKFLSFMDLKLPSKLDLTFGTIDIMSLAISIDDTAMLRTAMQKSNEMHHDSWRMLWELAHTHLKWDVMKILMSGPYEEEFLQATFLWLIGHHKWDDLQNFSDFIRSTDELPGYLRSSNPNFWKPYERIARSCAELIYERGLQDLELFLDIVRQLGINSRVLLSASVKTGTQLAILPALASQKLSIFKLLYDARLISTSMTIIGSSEHKTLLQTTSERLYPRLTDLLPLDLAIAFMLDLEIVEHLCRNGVHLHPGWNYEEPGTLRKLRLTTSVADARQQNCYTKSIIYERCYEISLVRKDRYSDDLTF